MGVKKRLLKPEVLGGFLGMIIVSYLMVAGEINSTTGVTILIGILAAQGAYQADSPKQK